MSTLAGTWPFDANGAPLEHEPIIHYGPTGLPSPAWLRAMREMEAEAEDTERNAA